MIPFKLLALCIMFLTSAKTEFTTLRTYSMDIPELDPITIIEGDPLWEQKKSPKKYLNNFDDYQSPTSTNLNNPIITETDDSNNQFSATALKEFLEKYAEKLKQDKIANNSDVNYPPITIEQEEDKRKKNGNLLNLKQYMPPLDDKTGWVSLEPVPWSVSQISKWHSKPNPPEYNNNWDHQSVDSTWENFDRLGISSTGKPHVPNRYQFTPPVHKNKIKIYETADPDQMNLPYQRPFGYHRPIYQILTEDSPTFNKNVIIKDNKDIITDGLTPNFPRNQLNFNRRHGTELYSEPHSFTGDGKWVLLSTSKGYKYPKKQRSMKMSSEFVDSHKSVQLTVLPPLKDSNVNMTTSHGGLLQVESTFEPVEQALKKFRKMQKIKNKRKRPSQLKKKKKIQTLQTVHKVIPRSTSDSGAVLAGVGAGLIPATMAMMMPLVINGKKRKRRSIPNVKIQKGLNLFYK